MLHTNLSLHSKLKQIICATSVARSRFKTHNLLHRLPCFRLEGPNAAKYPWKSPEEKIGTSDISTTSQFAHCTHDYMAFGGSQEHCTNAIRIDSDLLSASTGPSDTYDNPCLVPEEKANPFRVGDIEVFCGRSMVGKSGKPKSIPRKDK
jgi:hypothetical protein